MVIAYHLIWTAYGWSLPNDPRGSMSRFVASDVIAKLGELHHGRTRVQPSSRLIREFYDAAAPRLKFPLLSFSQSDFDQIAHAFADEIRQQSYTCYACAIMPDHVHLLIRKHKHSAEEMIHRLQDASRQRLLDLSIRENGHSVWEATGGRSFSIIPTRFGEPSGTSRTIRSSGACQRNNGSSCGRTMAGHCIATDRDVDDCLSNIRSPGCETASG